MYQARIWLSNHNRYWWLDRKRWWWS